MNIRSSLIHEHSRAAAEKIANYVMAYPEKLDELVTCFFDEDLRMCQRAAWPVCKLGIQSPHLLEKYTTEMIANLERPSHDAVVRNTVRVWSEMQIPEVYEGQVFDICFYYLCDRKIAVAIRAFSITVAGKIAKKYPELADELRIELQNQLQYETKPAVLVRLRRYVKVLSL